jgi:shikimate dehydrogenase
MRLGLVGMPVSHSLSPEIHEVFFRETGIQGTYQLLPTESDGLAPVLRKLREGGFQGLNVTMPHKKRIFQLCDALTPEALKTKAVNALRMENEGLLIGHNTDTAAFSETACGLPEPFLVVGGGGASMAVAAALDGRKHLMFRRNPGLPSELPLSDLCRHFSGACGTVVNATPLGWGDDDPFPWNPPEGWVFYDLNYNPGWIWRNNLRRTGILVRTGEEMLVRQGAGSFRFWTGCTVPEQVIGLALERVRRLLFGHN